MGVAGAVAGPATSIKDGVVDSLYVDTLLVHSGAGKLQQIAATQPTGNVGRGYNNNTYFPGDIAEIIVYPRALCELERELIESYLTDNYFDPVVIPWPS